MRVLRAIGPGLLVAATGVGAGDLATAAFAGDRLGVAVVWAVAVGAAMKFALNEGLARWQLATGETFLEGVARRLGRGALAAFLAYFALWSFFVGAALMSACGAALHAMIPAFDRASDGKVAFGLAASAAGYALVRAGGYTLFARVMSACIAAMFVTVVVTAGLVWPGTAAVARGLVPSAAVLQSGALGWTVALIGGVGGTVTILCYGYWIREEGRAGLDALPTCRVDLGVGYAATALFGAAMVVVGSAVHVDGRGAALVVALGDALGRALGPAGRWLFLAGAFGAVFSSLLGVWQAVPYLFADVVRLLAGRADPPDDRSRAYRAYAVAIATVPALGLVGGFRAMQKLYATVGAAFVPLLALGLLVLCGRAAWIGRGARNGPASTAALAATLAFFAWLAIRRWLGG
ncbi:MAG: iron transporter [Deltaproteobacteria bacterium]|nr:MAG: iron transporter [Deltaproteobacteria bacterium]